jgi:hypothetical protein
MLKRQFLIDENREYVDETRIFFDNIKHGNIDGYTSVYVLEELEKAPASKKDDMLKLLADSNINVLEYNDKAFELADLYISLGIIPKKSRIDGVHIAMAAINNMDFIISLNFKHINKIKTKLETDIIHKMLNYNSPIICTPMEVIENE